MILADSEAVLWDDLLADKVEADTLGRVIPFDVVSGIAAFLTDKVNDGIIAANPHPHHYIDAPRSFQGQQQILTVPVVNRYVNLVGDVLRQCLNIEGIPLFPDGKQYAIGLSHDVDRLQRRGLIRALAAYALYTD